MSYTTKYVLFIGPRKAGKSVYLCSMFHKLSHEGQGDIGYVLEAPIRTQRLQLTDAHSSLNADEWLPATDYKIYEWEFDVTVRHAGYNYRPLRIIYYDYAGGRLHDPNQDPKVQAETQTMLVNANLMAGIIDGDELYRRVIDKNRPRRDPYWDVILTNICLDIAEQNKPTQFVISKWDIFRDTNEMLQLVIDELKRHGHFKSLIKQRFEQGQDDIRVIPFSAVGRNFARREEFRKMVILSDGTLESEHVEVPFAAILPQTLQDDALKAADAASANIREADARAAKQDISWSALFSGAGGSTLSSFARVFAQLGLSPQFVSRLSQQGARLTTTYRSAITDADASKTQRLARLKAAMKNEQDAFELILESMFETVARFDDKYPASTLQKRDFLA